MAKTNKTEGQSEVATQEVDDSAKVDKTKELKQKVVDLKKTAADLRKTVASMPLRSDLNEIKEYLQLSRRASQSVAERTKLERLIKAIS